VENKIMRRKLLYCKNKEQFSRELLRRRIVHNKQVKPNRSGKFYQATVKHLRDIRKLKNGYKMIAWRKKLL